MEQDHPKPNAFIIWVHWNSVISPVQAKTGRMGYFRAIMNILPKNTANRNRSLHFVSSFLHFLSSPLHLFPTFRLLNPYVFGNIPSPPSTARNCWSDPSPRNCAESKFPPWRSNLRFTQNKRKCQRLTPTFYLKNVGFWRKCSLI